MKIYIQVVGLILMGLFIMSCCNHQERKDDGYRIEQIKLQEVIFADSILQKAFQNNLNHKCFFSHIFYVIEFYQSDLDKDDYFVSIDEFDFNCFDITELKYYIKINDRIFLLKEMVPKKLFIEISNKQIFNIGEDTFTLRGDIYFLMDYRYQYYCKFLLNNCTD